MNVTKCLSAMFGNRDIMESEVRDFFSLESKILAVAPVGLLTCATMLWASVDSLTGSGISSRLSILIGLAGLSMALTVGAIALAFVLFNRRVSTTQYAWALRLRSTLRLPVPQRSMTKKDLVEYVIRAQHATPGGFSHNRGI